MIELRGRVASGVGDLAGWMRRYAAEYAAAVGMPLEPGSLNVVLDGPWVMQRPDIRLKAAIVGVDVGLIRCRLNGLDCWLFRTDKNNRAEGDHALNVIEIISSAHLRNSLGLTDGDEVLVQVEPEPTGPVAEGSALGDCLYAADTDGFH